MDYQLWPSKKWKVTSKDTAVADLDTSDMLRFTIVGTGIKVSSVGCNHFGGGGPHSGAGWQEVCQPLAGDPETVQGATFLIKSKTTGSKTQLKCTLNIPSGSTGGGACWTAEDG